MSKIVLGTVQFGTNYGINNKSGQVPMDEVVTILRIALDAGIKKIDTSSGYRESEMVLGKAMRESATTFNLISKYPTSKVGVKETFMESLSKLGVRRIYGYMVHHFDYYLDRPDIYKEILELKDEGKVQKTGFSLYNVEQLQYLLDHSVPIDILQFPYNIFDKQFEPYMVVLKDLGVEIHTRSAFLQGLFFMDTEKLPFQLRPLKKDLEDLHTYCRRTELTVEQLALGYVIANENVDGALIGVDNHIQLEANLKAATHRLSKEDIDFIKSINIKHKELLNPVNWK